MTALELEHDRRPIRENQRVTHRIVRRPDLYVSHIEGVADIDRAVEQNCRTIEFLQLCA